MSSIVKETRNPQERLHSYNDEPALINDINDKYWYFDGKRHRDNGPAVILGSGSKIWYHHGKVHREDGPAIEWGDGDVCWRYNGKSCSFFEWLKLSSIPEEIKTEMKLTYD